MALRIVVKTDLFGGTVDGNNKTTFFMEETSSNGHDYSCDHP